MRCQSNPRRAVTIGIKLQLWSLYHLETIAMRLLPKGRSRKMALLWIDQGYARVRHKLRQA